VRLPTQIFIGNRPVEDKFVAVRNYGTPDAPIAGVYKPSGGIWTSTWETAFEIGWPWWCLAEDFHEIVEGWLLEPRPCRVLTIDDFETALAFMRQYGTTIKGLSMTVHPEWEKVAVDYDAVRVTNPYSPGLRFGAAEELGLLFYGWDCESTVWLRWCFEGEATYVDLSEQAEAARKELVA
jgi:hypothetical protein